jgi:transposase
MTVSRVEVITSVQRRRRWSRGEKERIVAAALRPGAVASEVARQAGIHTSQLFRWRRQLCGPAAPAAEPSPAFAPVVMAQPEPTQPMTQQLEGQAAAGCGSAPSAAPGVIEVAFAAGVRVRISGAIDPALVSAALGALAAARRR